MGIAAGEWMLKPSDQELRGFWIDLGSRMEKDAQWHRIEWLTQEHLDCLVHGEGGRALYRDPEDGRLWELGFDYSQLKGGGPPRLTCIGRSEAEGRYSWRETG